MVHVRIFSSTREYGGAKELLVLVGSLRPYRRFQLTKVRTGSELLIGLLKQLFKPPRHDKVSFTRFSTMLLWFEEEMIYYVKFHDIVELYKGLRILKRFESIYGKFLFDNIVLKI